MIKLLSILGSIGMVGAASSTIITSTNKTQVKTINRLVTVDRSQLKAKIREAELLLINSTKTEWANLYLETAIGRAQAIFDDQDALQSKIDETTRGLGTAIELFKASPEASNRERLQALINEAKELLANSNKGEMITMLFKAIVNSAEMTFNNPNATPKSIDSAIKMLEEAMVVYKDSPEIS